MTTFFSFKSEVSGLNRSVKETTPFRPFHRLSAQNDANDAKIPHPFGNDSLRYIARRDCFLSGEAPFVYTFLTIATFDRIFSPAPGDNQ